MESDLQPNHHNLLHHQQQQMNSGLMRFRSAPSSYFANLLDSEDCEECLNPRPSSPETERIISRFFTSIAGGGGGDGGEDSPSGNLGEIRQNSQSQINQQNQFMTPMKIEEEVIQQQQQSNYSSASQMMYQNNNPPPLPNQSNSGALGSAMDGSFRVASSMGMDRFPQMKMGSGSNSNLIRHSSSPAGLFSNINIENGYVTMGGMGNFGGRNGNTGGETSFSSNSRMKNQMNFASGPPSSSGLMSPISELGNKNMGQSSTENDFFEENRSSSFITGFPNDSWDDSALMTDNFSGLKRARDDTFPGLNASLENQSEGDGNRPPRLSHHLSLPKTSTEMAAMENLLEFQDSVRFKIRAKRGCATHPRSIAERVRRTRISERMRKLQELVPNMDKQTNTADMLDLAVDYIKNLQKEVKTLADNRAKCTCSSKQKL